MPAKWSDGTWQLVAAPVTNELSCLQYFWPAWNGPAPLAFTTTRQGGVSREPFATLNLSYCVGDLTERVRENRRRVLTAWNIPARQLHIPRQTHSANVRVIQDNSRPPYLNTDGLIVHRQSHAWIGVLTADCLPVFLFDPVSQAYGLIHAGRRGLVLGILSEAIAALRSQGANPSDVRAVLGVGIQQEHYPLGAEHLRQFVRRFGRGVVSDGCANLFAAAQRDLCAAGLRPEHIAGTALSTAGRTDLFYSHRAEEGRTGRMLSLIGHI